MRIRTLQYSEVKLTWVRLDDLKNMIGTWRSWSSNYINSDTTKNYPIYAIAFNPGYPNKSSDLAFFTTQPDLFTENKDVSRARILIWTWETGGEYIQYRDEAASNLRYTGYLSMTGAGWEVGQPIDVLNRGTVTPSYVYYSSDASRCSAEDFLAGTIVYFVRYQYNAALDKLFVLTEV